MHVVSHGESPSEFTEFGHQTDPNRPPSRPKILPKLVPGGVGSHWVAPSAPQERQEASQERSRGAPGAPQGAPRAPRSAKKGAQEAPKAPQDGQDGRQVASKSPLRARKSIFWKSSFFLRKTYDFRGSGAPRWGQDRPKSPLGASLERLRARKVDREGLSRGQSSDSGRPSRSRGQSGGQSGASRSGQGARDPRVPWR